MAANREALLDAAGRVFLRVGYAGATIDAIADDAGFTKVRSTHTSGPRPTCSCRCSRDASRREPANRQLTWRSIAHQMTSPPSSRSGGSPLEAIGRGDSWCWNFASSPPETLRKRYAAAHRRTVEGVARSIEILFERLDRTPARPPSQLAALVLALDVGGFLEELVHRDAIPRRDLPGIVASVLGLPIANSRST